MRMAQQVPVVDRAQAEVPEPQVAGRVDRASSLRALSLTSAAVASDQPLGVAEGDGLR